MDEQREPWPQPLVESIDRWLGRAYGVEPLLYADLLLLRQRLAATPASADVSAHSNQPEPGGVGLNGRRGIAAR